jgi:hypothetical protein
MKLLSVHKEPELLVQGDRNHDLKVEKKCLELSKVELGLVTVIELELEEGIEAVTACGVRLVLFLVVHVRLDSKLVLR